MLVNPKKFGNRRFLLGHVVLDRLKGRNPKVEVTFEVDAEGKFHVSAKQEFGAEVHGFTTEEIKQKGNIMEYIDMNYFELWLFVQLNAFGLISEAHNP